MIDECEQFVGPEYVPAPEAEPSLDHGYTLAGCLIGELEVALGLLTALAQGGTLDAQGVVELDARLTTAVARARETANRIERERRGKR